MSITLLRSVPLTMVMRACALVLLVAVAGVAHAHPDQASAPADAAASQGVAVDVCCHDQDQGAPQADCAAAPCCTLSALAGKGAPQASPQSASQGPVIGARAFAGRAPPPILHPPIAT